MSRRKEESLAEKLAEQLLEQLNQLKSDVQLGVDRRERNSHHNAAIATADNVAGARLGLDTKEHAKRVRNDIANVFAQGEGADMSIEARLIEVHEDATALRRAIEGTARPVSNLERTPSDTGELAETIVRYVHVARGTRLASVREGLRTRVRQAIEIIARDPDFDSEMEDLATAVQSDFTEANVCGFRRGNEEWVEHYLKRAEENAAALRDALRACADSDDLPGRRLPR